jgi:ABC-type transport system involved in multi-copper enzyme maturation permease subunit
MARWIPRFRLWSFALLGKELTEQACRKRTYWLRCIFVLILLVCFLIVFEQVSREIDRNNILLGMYAQRLPQASSTALGMIGRGRPLFDIIYWTLSGAILLIMPTFSAVSISQEKEQGSLTTLLLTPMGPWEILLQKYLSGVIAMGSFILLALPLFAICFEIGGVESQLVWSALYLLTLTCLQTGAVCLAVSSWCRSSMVAICMSFVALMAMCLGQPVVLQLMHSGHGTQGFFTYNFLNAITGSVMLRITPCICPLNSYIVFDYLQQYTSQYPAQGSAISPSRLVIDSSYPALVSVGLFLVMARVTLIRRAEIAGMNPLLRGMLVLDRFFSAIDAKIGRKTVRDLPISHPVRWHELNRRSLANWRYLIRIFLPLGVLLLVLLFYAGIDQVSGSTWLITAIVMSVPIIAGIALLILGTGLLAEERTQQALEVLLSTPLSARQIVAQKVGAFRRIHGAFLVLMLIACVVRWVFIPGFHGSDIVFSAYYLVTGLVMLPAILRLGILAGIVIRGRTQSVIAALVCVAVWLGAIPLALLALSQSSHLSWAPTMGSQLYWVATHMSPIFAFLEIRDQGEYYLNQAASFIPTWNEKLDDQWMVGLGTMTASCLLVWGGARLACQRWADRSLRQGSRPQS